MKRLLLTAILMMSFASFAFGQAQTAEIRKAIEANTKALVAAFNKGDAAAVAGMYTKDAKLLPPNSEMVEGTQNIQAYWQGAISAGAKLEALDTVEVEARGDMAAEVGKYTLTIPQAGGQTVTDQGKYLVVWKKQGQTWKLALDIWNTNKPLPTP